MSQNTPTEPQRSGTDTQQLFQVPSLLTNSTRAILNQFGDSIHELTANGTRETANRRSVDDLNDYGVYVEHPQVNALGINYRRREYDGDVVNPLTPQAVDRLEDEIDVQLNDEDLSVTPDVPVNKLTIRVTNDALQEAVGTRTATFDLTFVADKAENALLPQTKLVNAGRGLYSELGFAHMHLNLRSVVETAAQRHEQSSATVMSWGGPGDLYPKSPDILAVRIVDQVLPDDIGFVKPYNVVNGEFITVDEEALDDRLTDASGGEN